MERREVGGDGRWEKAAFNNVQDTRLRVTGLTPKKVYEFRVCAVNAAGAGKIFALNMKIIAKYRCLVSEQRRYCCPSSTVRTKNRSEHACP